MISRAAGPLFRPPGFAELVLPVPYPLIDGRSRETGRGGGFLMRLQGKVAMITGGGSGIGRAIA
ncbi:MAG: hypothetical protein WBK60_09895, partial [bacterium]